VEKNGTAKIICLNCKCSRSVDFSKYKKVSKAVKVRVKCKCVCTQVALLERRNRRRKSTNLKGIYKPKLVGRNIDQELIEVKNLSADGIRFRFVDNNKYEFKPNDELLVEFSLNEMSESPIRKEVKIKGLNMPFISAQFKNKSSLKEDLLLKIFLYE
jgi:hypothetical protein